VTCAGLAGRAMLQTMRLHHKGALLWFLFCPAAIPAAWAQHKQAVSNRACRVTREDSDVQPNTMEYHPLTLDEGLAILGAALDSRHHASFLSDCSHFVHGLYTRAGFPYQYAPSADLYAGIDAFQRVASPQPGDLAVWRGHTGVVINPVQHSFFSLLSSGPEVDFYDSPYWKQRGRPRFFRYVKAAPTTVRSTVASGSSEGFEGSLMDGGKGSAGVRISKTETQLAATGRVTK
jgi:hypothetical protein